MVNFQWAALALMLLAAGPGLAQNSKPDSVAAAAAMERAQRLAASPMRVILEASKIRRKTAADAEPAPDAADAAHLRRTAARTGGAPDPAATPARDDPVLTPRSMPAPKAAPAEPVAVLLTMGGALAEPASTAVAAIETSNHAAAVAAMPNAAPPLAALAATLMRPKLVSMVEPAIPPRLLDDVARLSEVLADLTIRPDGGVAGVVLVTLVPRQLQRPITAALEQWRFEPLNGTRVHRVELVFNPR